MMHFRENFFFVKFSVLFFLVLIFGYWGIDLNSEELYIAFSFLFLVVLAFVLSRQALLFIFVKSVNAKFSRMILDLFVVIGALILQLSGLTVLRNYFKVLSQGSTKFCAAVTNLLGADGAIFATLVSVRLNHLSVYFSLGVSAFGKVIARNRRVASVAGGFSRFFTINL